MKYYVVDIGLAGADEQLVSKIVATAEKYLLTYPSSGYGFGVRDMQFEGEHPRLADQFCTLVTKQLKDDRSYAGVYTERRGWSYDLAYKVGTFLSRWTNKPLDFVLNRQCR